MPVRVFKEEEKHQIREKLLNVGFPMLKEYGMIHMSIPKIAKAAEIGTGTFYRFFKSKEEYIYQLILYRRELLLSEVITEEVRSGKRKLSKDEVRHIIELIVDKDKSIYANLSLSDEAKLFEYIEEFSPDIKKEKSTAGELLRYLDTSKKDIDFPVLFNIVKVLAITSQAVNELHPEGYEKTISLIIDVILKEIYG